MSLCGSLHTDLMLENGCCFFEVRKNEFKVCITAVLVPIVFYVLHLGV